MGIDYFLYVAFGAGLLAGRLIRWRGPALTWATSATVVVLLFALGASLAPSIGPSTVGTILLSVGYAALILALTLAFVRLLPRPQPTAGAPPTNRPASSRWIGLVFLASVVVGGVVGSLVSVPTAQVLTWALYVLLFLVAFGLVLSTHGLSHVWVTVGGAVAGATVAALVFAALTGVTVAVSFAVAFGFAWYTLAGPLVGASAGASLGLLAFLTNFLRENLTMLTSPVLGRRVRGEGLSAMGGAASMDTVLYFVTRYGDPEAGPLALATGLILTLTASVVLPLFLGPS